LTLLSAIGCAAGQHAAEIAVERRAWSSPVGTAGVRILTDHYDLRVTTRDELLRQYLPGFMETAYGEYRRLMPPARQSDDRLVTYLFGTRPEWAQFTKMFRPAQAYTYLHIHSGGYMDHATATSVFWDIRRDRTLSLMAHEGLHQYLARHFSEPVPPWLNEGLATQFEDFELQGDRPTFTPHNNRMRKNSLREAVSLPNGLIPLPDLLGMDAGRAVRKTGQMARGYYAQVWSMIQFLRENRTYREKFARLLADAGTQRMRTAVRAYRAATPNAAGISDGEAVFRQYITEDFDPFMADYIDFARHLVN